MLSILKNFLLRIYRAIKWFIKNKLKLLFTTIKDIIINVLSSIVIKKITSYKMIINTLSFIFTGTALLAFNFFGLTDYFKDSFLFRLFTNLGIIGLFRSFNIKIIEWYQSIFTQEEISPKLKEKVFHQLEQQPQDSSPFISRSDYKDAIIKLKEEEHWYQLWQSMLAKVTAMLLIGFLLFFFGADIVEFLKVFFKKDDDDSDTDQVEVEEVQPQQEVDTKGKKREEINSEQPLIAEERRKMKKISEDLSVNKDFKPTFDQSLKEVGIKNAESLSEEMDIYFRDNTTGNSSSTSRKVNNDYENTFGPYTEAKIETAKMDSDNNSDSDSDEEAPTPKPKKVKLPRNK